jgi:hypothetical protein
MAYSSEPPPWAGHAAAVACRLSRRGSSIPASTTKIKRAEYPFGSFNPGRRSLDEWLTFNEVPWTRAQTSWTRSTTP